MPIRLLPPHIAERIAAGEVIERPSSVVKELVENSIDAGSTDIMISLIEGGKSLIEVLDNGKGMSAEDLLLCVKRHATSKIEKLEDLEDIHTLGFRGEALPSIAAVACLELLSRGHDQSQAYQLTLDSIEAIPQALPVTFGHFLTFDHGTRIQVKNLFSQVPARLKFLKSSRAEVAAVKEWIEKLAISHPEIGFKLLSDDRTLLNLRACRNESDRLTRYQTLLTDGEAYPVVTVEDQIGDLELKLHWFQGLSLPTSKKMVQIVNGRILRDRLIQQAIMQPLRQALMPGQYPALILSVQIDPAELDVNVHPTKTEVRFLEGQKIFRAVHHLVEQALGNSGSGGYLAAPSSQPVHEQHSFSSRWMESPKPVFTASSGWQALHTEKNEEPLRDREITPATPEPVHFLSGYSYRTILFNTYIVFEKDQELCLVDQHAAHERVRYEQLQKTLARGDSISSQELLIPETVQFAVEDRLQVERVLPLLMQLGFSAEIFGDQLALFRSIPTAWGSHSLKIRLKNLLGRLLEQEDLKAISPAALLDEVLFEKLASEACRSSVRAGDVLEPWEAQTLVNDLGRCEHPWNCPHGRPTLVKIPELKFEEWFKRKL